MKKSNGIGTQWQAPFWLVRLAVVAATVMVLWVTANFIFYDSKSAERIYYTYYQPYTNVLKPVIESGRQESHAFAMELYENGNYREALAALEGVIVEGADNLGWQFYHGICQLELKNTDFAIADFEYITNANDPIFSAPSNWYLGLAYLRLDRKGEAVKVFRSISASDGPFRKEAAEILALL